MNLFRKNTDVDMPPVGTDSEQEHSNEPAPNPTSNDEQDDTTPTIQVNFLEQRHTFKAQFHSLCFLNEHLQCMEYNIRICNELEHIEGQSLEPESGKEADRTLEKGEFSDPQATKQGTSVKRKLFHPQRYRHCFLNAPDIKIRKTFEATTQFSVSVLAGHKITQTLRSPFPAHNVVRRNEPVATDTVCADVPAHGTGGQKLAQIFVGKKSLVVDACGIGSTKEFVNTLLDNIRSRGAPDKLISDSAKVEMSERVLDVTRNLLIDTWQSETQVPTSRMS